MQTPGGFLLLDTDILILLLASGTLPCVCQHFGHSPNNLRRLAASIYQIRRGRKFRDVYGQEVLARIEPLVSQIKEVDPPKNLALVESLALNVNLDPGEAQLIAVAAESPCTLLLSGDKRAISALATSGLGSCIENLKGRIVSLEAILWFLIKASSASGIRASFLPVIEHKTLKIVLSEHASQKDDRCFEAIKSYFDAMHKTAGGVLYNPDPEYLGLTYN